jgi:hypothetical protein
MAVWRALGSRVAMRWHPRVSVVGPGRSRDDDVAPG